MKAIQTIYKGYKFRSRLEARWAVFLDALEIEWVYEEEGFVLEDGTCYLPDFYLPTFGGGTFVEVKPKFKIKEKQICRDLCFESSKSVWLAEGVPDFVAYVYLVRQHKDEDVTWFIGLPNADQAFNSNCMYAEPEYVDLMTLKVPESYYACLGDKFINAVYKAKQARFEHKDKE